MIWSAALAPAILLTLASSVEHVGAALDLILDDCVDADRQEVVRLVEIELGGVAESAAAESAAAESVRRLSITCTGEPDVVKVADPSRPEQSARLVDLRALGAAERKARARELALVIREVLDTPRPPLPAPVKAPPLAPAASKKRPRASAEVSLLAGAEKYSAGYAQLGPSLALRLTPLSRLVLELRVGARFAPQLRAAAGDVSAHGFIGSLGVGLNLLPTEASASLVLVGRVESNWIFIQGSSYNTDSVGQSANGFALIGSIASSASLALSPRLRIALEPALLVPIRGLVIDDRGRAVSSIAGIGAGTSLGLSLEL